MESSVERFEIKKLPPNEGVRNRAARFMLLMLDKMLHPDSNKVVGGGEYVRGAHAFRPEITQRDMNNIAREHDLRRYDAFGVGSVVGGNFLPQMYRRQAEGTLHIIEPIYLDDCRFGQQIDNRGDKL